MTLPAATPFVPDEDADANAVNDRFEAIESRFNAGILDEDISATAMIRGTKLSNRNGEQIPTDRLANNCVTEFKLQQDVANNSSRAVGTDHIKDLAVTAPKLAASVLSSQITLGTVAFSEVLANNGAAIVVFGISPTWARATYELVGCYIRHSGIGASYVTSFVVDTTDATNWAGWLTLKEVGGGGGTAAGTLVLVFFAK